MTKTDQHIEFKCIICGSKDFTLCRSAKDPEGYSVEIFKFYQCSSCSFVELHPKPSKEDLGKHYPAVYYGKDESKFKGPVEGAINIFRSLKSKKLLKLKSSGSVLDIGCGRGHILKILEEKGFTVTGTELSEDSSARGANHLGLNVLAVDIVDADFKEGEFDIITLWHVFEHLYEPDLALEKIKYFLKSDGVLLISIPNFGSLQSRLSKNKWFQLDPPRHLYHFTPDTLEALLNKHGFRVIKKSYSSLEFNYFDMVQSVYNILGVRKNFLYNLLRGTGSKFLEEDTARTFLDILLSIIYAPIVFPLGFFLTFITNKTKLGGNIEMIAQQAEPAPNQLEAGHDI